MRELRAETQKRGQQPKAAADLTAGESARTAAELTAGESARTAAELTAGERAKTAADGTDRESADKIRRLMSMRLRTVAGMVRGGGCLADIGTDHAYVPVFLVASGQFERALALDINAGPLERARENIREARLENRIRTRLSDGMAALNPGEASTAVIAGMGGALTVRILEKDPKVTASLEELVLQPQSEIFRVRTWLWQYGWYIDDESMVLEDGKYYPVMRAVHDVEMAEQQAWEDHVRRGLSSCFGPKLLESKDEVLKSYLEWEKQVKEDVLRQLDSPTSEGAMLRRKQVEAELERNREAWNRIRG